MVTNRARKKIERFMGCNLATSEFRPRIIRAFGKSVACEKFVLGFSEWDDGEAANSDEWRIREELFRFDFAQCDGLGEWLSCFDLDRRIFGIGVIHGNDGGGADGALAVAGFVDDQFVAGLHPAKIL